VAEEDIDNETPEKEEAAPPQKTNGAALLSGPITVKLRKPIQANGEEVSELVFREPNGGDIERCGNPVDIDPFQGETVKLSFNEKKMTQMMSRLASVPPSSIRMMNPKDWNSIAWQLLPFFTPDL
jgi:hypothetical protein